MCCLVIPKCHLETVPDSFDPSAFPRLAIQNFNEAVQSTSSNGNVVPAKVPRDPA